MNELSQIQVIGISVVFSIAFFILLYATHRLFKVELKGDWGLVAVAAFPFLVYAVVNILSTDVLKKEIGLSVGVVNVQLIKDPSTTKRPELYFDREVEPEARHGPKGAYKDVKKIIEDARKQNLSTLLVDADKYIIDLHLVDKYASKSGYLFKHVVFVEDKKFLGYATPHDIDWYINSDRFDKTRDFYMHLRYMPLQTDTIYNTTSEHEALEIMERRGIEIIAVLDSGTGAYKGLASRQEIAESMLSQLFTQIRKFKTSGGSPIGDEYVSTLKEMQKEIRQLVRVQSQQLGLLQGSVRQTTKRSEREYRDLDSERGQIEQRFVPASR